jgi:hypothetical protein
MGGDVDGERVDDVVGELAATPMEARREGAGGGDVPGH